MRLTEEQHRAISEEVARVFGAKALVRLFGSRLDDNVRGGDIDLHIEAIGTPSRLLDCELRLRARLARRLGDRRIDVVVLNTSDTPRPIDSQARRTGIRL